MQVKAENCRLCRFQTESDAYGAIRQAANERVFSYLTNKNNKKKKTCYSCIILETAHAIKCIRKHVKHTESNRPTCNITVHVCFPMRCSSMHEAKTNNVISGQVRHKPACTSTDKS